MFRTLFLLPLSLALLTAADEPWKDKQIADWNQDDTTLILSNSPWAVTVEPTLDRSAGRGQNQAGRRMGRGGMGGIGIQIPGIGRGGGGGYPGGGYPGGGYPGGGYPGGGYPGGQQPGDTGGGSGSDSVQPPKLTVRWESALPIREAELKARDTNAPTVDEAHYAIAVYGVPRAMASGSSQTLLAQLKKQASIKRDGKKDLAPSSVEVLQRDDGPVVVYLFPHAKEITAKDKRLEFDAKIGRLSLTPSFFLDDMTFQGKLEI